MAVLKRTLIICCVLTSLNAMRWDGLYAKGSNQEIFELPNTNSEAESQGWVAVPSDSNVLHTMCLPDDGRVCTLYDEQGIIAGIDIGLLHEDYDKSLDTSKYPEFSNVTRFNQTITRGRVMFVDEDILKSGGRSNMNNGTGNGLWVQKGTQYENIPLTGGELELKANYTKENCISGMGGHYYYNMLRSMDCLELEPFYVITDPKSDEVHGFGFQSVGKPSYEKKKWFVSTPWNAMKTTVPNSPDCLMDMASNNDIISMHVYMRSNPWLIHC